MPQLQDETRAIVSPHRTEALSDDGWRARRHIKVRMYDGGFLLEHCEQEPCLVDETGVATCGRLACPRCAHGSGNLSVWQLAALSPGDHVVCACGYMWIPHPHDADSTAAVLTGLASALCRADR